MSAEFKLREYQTEAIDAVFTAWSEGLQRPAVVLPTGAGKTVVFAHMIRKFRDDWLGGGMGCAADLAPGNRVIVLVHRDELADQAIDKIRAIAPDLSVGKVKASQNEITSDVMVCSVQTLAVAKRLNDLVLADRGEHRPRVGLIITDECHHAAAPSYQKVYARFPDALQVGVTATLQRGDGVGLGGVWEDVVYRKSPLWMISRGYLVDVKAHTATLDMDLSAVKQSRGDYQAAALGQAMEDAQAEQAITRLYREHAADRPGVVFTPTVATAYAASDALNAAGIASDFITGETIREDRQRIFRDFREGRTQVLVNCMVLTEGFDAPWASCALIARPTRSEPLYQQMVGRVLRTWPGKADALVLHLAGAGGTLRTLVDLDPTVPLPTMKDGETLTEAVEREHPGAPPGTVAFDLKMKEHNLFAGSAYAWSKTERGVLFIECGEQTVFLWPHKQDDLYSVCTMEGYSGQWQQTDHRGLDLASAMAWGEAVAEDGSSFAVTRSARWRGGKPSDKQVALAERYGIDPRGMNRGRLSEAIGTVIASRKFDRYVGHIYL